MTLLTNQQPPRGAVVLEWSMAAVALVVGIVVASFGWAYGLTNVTGVGAGFFPAAAGILIAVSGALWLVQLALARRAAALVSTESTLAGVVERFEADDEIDEDGDDAEFPDRAGWARVGIIAAAILVAALVLPVIGYTLTMTLMLTTVLLFVSKRPWWLAVIIGVGAAIASRLVFEGWLGTELPSSSLEFIARLGL